MCVRGGAHIARWRDPRRWRALDDALLMLRFGSNAVSVYDQIYASEVIGYGVRHLVNGGMPQPTAAQVRALIGSGWDPDNFGWSD